MPGTRVKPKSVWITRIRKQAEELGIRPGEKAEVELVRAIQEAQGNIPCFGRTSRECPDTQCRFRSECLKAARPQACAAKKVLKLSEKIPCVVTIKSEWIEKGVLAVPPRLSNYMAGTNTVHILYEGVDVVLPYEEKNRRIEGLDDFYFKNVLAEGDRVYVQVKTLHPTRLLLSPCW